MTQHMCPRCGHEDPCSYGSWFDRHPVLGVVGGMFGLVFMGMLFSVYTLGALIMTAIVGVAVGGRAAVRGRQRRAALVRRAEWEHAALMTRSAPAPERVVHVIEQAPATRFLPGNARLPYREPYPPRLMRAPRQRPAIR